MRKFIAIVIAGLVGIAAGTAPADEAGRLALAKQLMAQIHEDETVRSSVPLLMANLRARLAEQGQTSESVQAYVTRYEQRLTAEIGRYSDAMANAYADAFTEDDLKAMIAINETAIARKVIALRPALTQASLLAMRKTEEDIAAEVQRDIERERAQGASPRKM